jgi:aldose 1-epimerase
MIPDTPPPANSPGNASSATSAGGQGPGIPVTGAQYEISAGDYRGVVTELGAGLRELSHGGVPLVFGYEADELPPAAAGELLIPWPNRVDHGRYEFDGVSYQLDLSEAGRGNAIHGLTRFAAWLPVRHEPDSIVLRHLPHGYAGYPFCLEVEAGYRLSPAAGLEVTISAANRGTHPAPYGFGQHPYLSAGSSPAGSSPVDDWELALPATQWLPVDERGIPAGPVQDLEGAVCDFRRPRRIGRSVLDHALTGLIRENDGRAWAHLRAGGSQVSLWAGADCPWLQVFTSDTLHGGRHRKAVAIEPMTCPPNAFVTGDSLVVLKPGETVTRSWGVQRHPA